MLCYAMVCYATTTTTFPTFLLLHHYLLHVPDHTAPRAVVQYTQPQHCTAQHISAIKYHTQQPPHETPQQYIHNTQRSQRKKLFTTLPLHNKQSYASYPRIYAPPQTSFIIPSSIIPSSYQLLSSSYIPSHNDSHFAPLPPSVLHSF